VISCDSWDAKIINVELTVAYVGENGGEIPMVVELKGNYPNPFNPETEIAFRLPSAMEVELKVYNYKGQLVKTIAEANFPAGDHALVWNGTSNDGNSVSSGIYFYKLNAGGLTLSRKMVLLK
jgi:hypothetical protein